MEIHDAFGCMKCHPEQNTAIGESVTAGGEFGVDQWKEVAQVAYLEKAKKLEATCELIVSGGN